MWKSGVKWLTMVYKWIKMEDTKVLWVKRETLCS